MEWRNFGLGKSANDRPMRPSEAAHGGFIQVEVASDQIGRCESQPLVQRDILKLGTIEDVDYSNGC